MAIPQRERKRSWTLALGILILTSPHLFSESMALIKYPLDGAWEFRQAGQANWRQALVPGCVHVDLMAAGIIPDPFYRDNEVRVQWIENEDWEYRKEFKLPGTMRSKDHIDLVVQGLDTFATIFLNGQKVGETDNMFRGYRFDIKPFLRPDENELLIRFDSPVRRA
ncbi:MAG: sugar-binding domain-containing protein, partial [Candidatus Aminicenantales bacterium]